MITNINKPQMLSTNHSEKQSNQNEIQENENKSCNEEQTDRGGNGETINLSQMSKKQMKKLAKRQRYLDNRPAKRKIEKLKRKAKRRAEAQEREKLGIVELSIPKKFTLMSESTNRFKVVIDMDFEDYMTDNEIAKATKQLGRIYSLNRHSENPCQLFFTSLSGRIKDRMEFSHNGYKNWDVHLKETNYINALNDANENSTENFLYLSGDAEETMPNVDELLENESQIFVIGGLVDHNRHKNLCHNKAVELGIKTAKLPIKDYITLSQRHILSTVTVFEILIQVLSNRRCWEEALRLSIPKRKIKI